MADAWDDFYVKLYQEANQPSEISDPSGGGGDSHADSDNPLYESLRNIQRRYEREVLIGEGGCKAIYRVHDLKACRDVALARPRSDRAAQSYDAFLREAHMTARLEHANIIKLFDMGVEEDGTPFFTMEFKRGKSLHEKLMAASKAQASFPLKERLHVFLDVCDAIAYAHSRCVLHLDIKPENIQVGPYGEVQVCDWGLGEIAISRTETLTDGDALLDPDLYGDNGDPRMIKGTPGFMAPEQKKPGEPRTYQTDIYALGKTLAFLIESVSQIPTLAAIVDKAAAKEPSDRYPTVKALRDDIHRFMTLHPTSVEPGGAVREAWLFFRRHQRSSVIAVAALLLTMFLSTMFLTEIEISRREQLAAEKEAELAATKARLASREAKQAKSALAVTSQEKVAADLKAAKASHAVERAKKMARAMIDGRHAESFDHSFLQIELPGEASLDVGKSLDETIAYLEKQLAENPEETAVIRRQLGYAHLIAQRFDKAWEYYEGLAADPDLQRLIKKNAETKKYFSLRKFNGVLRRLGSGDNPRYALMEKMLVYDSAVLRKKDSIYEKLMASIVALETLNAAWKSDEDRVFWDSKKPTHLELSGASLKVLANTITNQPPYQSLLRTVPIKSLTLRDTGVKDLSHLSGVNLWQLELVNTTPDSFLPLKGIKTLRFLKVDAPALKRQAIEEVGRHVDVELIEPTDLQRS